MQHPSSLFEAHAPRRYPSRHHVAYRASNRTHGSYRPLHEPAESSGTVRSAATSSKASSGPSATPLPSAQRPDVSSRSGDVGGSSGFRPGSQDPNAALLAALAEQFQKESLPWIQDLVEPLLQGPPQPLKGTVSPELLADRDSRFATVNGIRVHYKMSLPGEKEGGNAAVGAAGGKPYRLAPSTAQAAAAPNPDAAPTMLLMHGLNGSTFNWRLLMDDLAAYISPSTGGCRVVAYDRPPYGLSERPRQWPSEEDNPYTLQGGARLACALLDALTGGLPSSSTTPSSAVSTATRMPSPAVSASRSSIAGRVHPGRGARRPAVLVGHSAGAAVAVEMALRYPDRVGGLVLIAPAIATDERGFLAQADVGQLMRFAWTRALLSADGTGINYVRRQVLKRRAEVEEGRLGIYVDEREVPQEVIDGYLRPLRAVDWDWGTLLAYRAFQVAGAPPPLEQLRVPVLVVQGRQDRAVPLEAAQKVVDTLRRRQGQGCVTEMVVLERCGHVPMDEKPLEVLKAVVDFVNRHCCGPDANPLTAAGAGGAATRSGGAAEGGALAPEVPQGTVMARLFGQGRGNSG